MNPPIPSPGRALLVLATLAVPGLATPLAAQEEVRSVDGFDPDRAILAGEPMFDPFRPTATRPLAEALEEGLVRDETPLLVMEVGGHRLALLTMQMSYHHVAQGKMAGEPWLVTF